MVQSMSVPLLVLRCVLGPVFLLFCLRLPLRLPFPALVLEFPPATPTTCQLWVCFAGVAKALRQEFSRLFF